MKILKFGGSSVASAENINKVVDIILQSSKKREQLVIVVSALGGITDELLALPFLAAKRDEKYKIFLKDIYEKHDQAIKELIKQKDRESKLKEISEKYKKLGKIIDKIYSDKNLDVELVDAVISFGEQFSAFIVSEAIKSRGVACDFVDSQALVKTDANFGEANVDIGTSYDLISKHFKNNKTLSVMGGFIASTKDGVSTTLGRGGSDYTAALVGAAVNASLIEIWTDVDGVMTTDPRKVKEAFSIPEISYEEAGELAYFGAKVIHPKTMRPAQLKGIPVDVKNTFNPEASGTRISNKKARFDFPITGISLLSNVSLLCIQSSNEKAIVAISSRLFEALSEFDIEILLTTQASYEQSLSVVIKNKQVEKARKIIEETFKLDIQKGDLLPVLVKENLSVIAIVGDQMKNSPGIAGRFFNVLSKSNINVVAIAQGSSEINISAVILAKDEATALQSVHREFFNPHNSEDHKVVNLFLIGTGVIGSELLEQIKDTNSPVRVCGLANIDFMVSDRKGIALRNWEQKLAKGKPAKTEEFIENMIALRLPKTVFVDCTASEYMTSFYEKIMNAGIAIVTPNKKANSGTFEKYKKLKEISQKNNAPFVYEANVGAGLPIIRTIQSLIGSGDKIIEIEAVLSGTLSYIFNTFSSSENSFSDIVEEAKRKGYTEPDPRDDLNGLDFARKMLILAREIGLPMELKHVKVEQLLSKESMQAKSVPAFFTVLKKANKDFEEQKIKAQKDNKKLCYIGKLKNGKAGISLQEISQNHPFYSLSSADNIISIKTKRYNTNHLVIRGPGAGAEVTAGGILGSITSILK